MKQNRSAGVVRPPALTRVVAWVVVLIGVGLVIGSVSGDALDVGSFVVGVVFAIGGIGLATARATCAPGGVVYRNLRSYHVTAGQVVQVTVENRGWAARFPTLVVYRRSGRPLVLRAVQDLRARSGRTRMERQAQSWRTLLGVPPAGTIAD